MTKKITRPSIDMHRAFGAAPIWHAADAQQPEFDGRVMAAMNWAKNMLDKHDLKAACLQWLESQQRDTIHLRSISPERFVYVGKIAWLIMNACPLGNNWLEKLEEKLAELQAPRTQDATQITRS